jgi:hypothetical protein
MPQTKPVEKPVMTQDQILKLIGGIQDLHDLCLMYVGIFCGPRASEVLRVSRPGKNSESPQTG